MSTDYVLDSMSVTMDLGDANVLERDDSSITGMDAQLEVMLPKYEVSGVEHELHKTFSALFKIRNNYYDGSDSSATVLLGSCDAVTDTSAITFAEAFNVSKKFLVGQTILVDSVIQEGFYIVAVDSSNTQITLNKDISITGDSEIKVLDRDNFTISADASAAEIISQILTNALTPAFENTDASEKNNSPSIQIRAKTNDSAGDFLGGSVTVKEVSASDSDAPGLPANWKSSEHGCLSDALVGYLAMVLTGAHQGRAIIVNEDVIFDTAHTYTDNVEGNVEGIGKAIINKLCGVSTWNQESDLTGINSFTNADAPVIELVKQMYEQNPERFLPYFTDSNDSKIKTLYVKDGSENLTLREGFSIDTSGVVTDANGDEVALVDQDGNLPRTDEYASLPFNKEDTFKFKLVVDSKFAIPKLSTDETQSKTVFENVTKNARNGTGTSPTYNQPAGEVNTDDDNKVLCINRSQNYEFKLKFYSAS